MASFNHARTSSPLRRLHVALLLALLLQTPLGDASPASGQAITPALAIANGRVVEGETSTTLKLVVTLRNPTGRRVTVDYTTKSGTAVVGQDFTAASGTLTFRGTRIRRTIRISVLGDTKDEPAETLSVVLRDPIGAAFDDRVGIGKIRDDDVTLTVVREGTGVVVGNLPGIFCGVDCTESYPQGTTITLTAEPTAPSTWQGWSGPCDGTDPCVITLDASKTLTATFEDYRSVTVSLPGDGEGRVSGQALGSPDFYISCGTGTAGICQAYFPTTETIYLNAIPDGGLFLGWGEPDACDAHPVEWTCVINPGTHDVEVQALFGLLPP